MKTSPPRAKTVFLEARLPKSSVAAGAGETAQLGKCLLYNLENMSSNLEPTKKSMHAGMYW